MFYRICRFGLIASDMLAFGLMCARVLFILFSDFKEKIFKSKTWYTGFWRLCATIFYKVCDIEDDSLEKDDFKLF